MGALAHFTTAMEQHGALGRHPTQRVAGTTWRWEFDGLEDADGNLIPLATMETFTADCKVYDMVGNIIAEPIYTAIDDGYWALEVDDSITAELGNEASNFGQVCQWTCSLSDGTDVIQMFALAQSPFLILRDETA